MTSSELRAAFAKLVDRVQWDMVETGYAGRLNDAGEWEFAVPTRPHWWWVRIQRGDNDVTISQALNLTAAVPESPDVPILIGKDIDGNDYIIGVRPSAAAIALGGKAPPIVQVASQEPVTGRRIEPGLVYVSSGLVAGVRSCFYRWNGEDFYFPSTTIDLSPYLPATAGKQYWAVVAIDPGTNQLTVVTGAEYAYPALPLTPSMVADIDYSAYIPLAAVKLYNGKTALKETDFLDIRLWVSGAGGSGGGGLVGDGSTLTVSNNAITITGAYHKVYSATATELHTISGGEVGMMLVLEYAGTSEAVTVKHMAAGGGNIFLKNGYDVTLETQGDSLLLIYDDALSAWVNLNSWGLSNLDGVGNTEQNANYVLAAGDGVTGGAYRGRALVKADLPTLDAGDITYTPTNPADWTDPDPANVLAALDALASGGASGGSAPFAVTKDTITIEKLIYDETLATDQDVTIDLTNVNGEDYSGWDHIRVIVQARTTQSDSTASGIVVRPNGDTSNYDRVYLQTPNHVYSSDGTPGAVDVPGALETAGNYGHGEIRIYNYSSATKQKPIIALSTAKRSGGIYQSHMSVVWNSTAPVTSLELASINAGSVIASGSRIQVYVIRESPVVTDVKVSGSAVTAATEQLEVSKVVYEDTLAANGSFNVDLTGVQDYDDLEVHVLVRTTRPETWGLLGIQFNGDATDTNYYSAYHYAGKGHVSSQVSHSRVMYTNGSTALTGAWGQHTISIKSFSSDGVAKVAHHVGATMRGPGDTYVAQSATIWFNTAAVTQFRIFSDGDPTNLIAAGSSIKVIAKKKLDLVTAITGTTVDLITAPRQVTLPLWHYSASSGTWDKQYNTAYIHNMRLLNSPAAQSDWVEWPVTLDTGTWKLSIVHAPDTDRGIASVYLDGIKVGEIDCYDATPAANVVAELAGITVDAMGHHTLRLVMESKNASSTDYYLALSEAVLTRTGT